jgi:hypothetical protein
MNSGGAPAPQAPPETHDPAVAAGGTWSPRRETARLAAFRPLAFPAGPLARYPAAGAAPPGAWPVARPDRPSLRRGSADSTRDGCRGGTAASSRPAPAGQARTARHQPPACEGITRRTAGRAWLPDLPGHWGGPADRVVTEAAEWKIRPSRPRPAPASSTAPPARRRPPPAMTAGPSGDDKDAGLDRLTRQYPQWRMWRGRATGDYWAMPPRGHPTAREQISPSDIGELARRLAQAEGRYGP